MSAGELNAIFANTIQRGKSHIPNSSRDNLLSPSFMKQIKPQNFNENLIEDIESEELEQNECIGDQDNTNVAMEFSRIARSPSEFRKLCSTFSPSALESIIAFLKDPQFIEDSHFIDNLSNLILAYKVCLNCFLSLPSTRFLMLFVFIRQ